MGRWVYSLSSREQMIPDLQARALLRGSNPLRRVPADLRVDSLSAVTPTSPVLPSILSAACRKKNEVYPTFHLQGILKVCNMQPSTELGKNILIYPQGHNFLRDSSLLGPTMALKLEITFMRRLYDMSKRVLVLSS
ncbi:hypothetical protein PoB_007277300 [Plakobranchus ocellatus]|uniref:Uncharacterized protein n=1 Tax=Plakobranchus ocellatus TaxID=259542 RepID=A0AAV4DQD4_9GAST|nr:hypothetical protein PoB_007277300 [Plakobranchus ocellatus]